MGHHHDDRAWTEAWSDAYRTSEPAETGKGRRRAGRSPRTRSVLLATGLLVLGISSVGVAQSTGVVNLGERNGTATDETEIIAREAAGTGAKGGYSTRQSNLSNSGGGAIYGCRSTAGGTPANKLPCLRGNNLSTGLAFEFAFEGPVGGTINSRVAGDSRKPFTTNATGVATGLNADRVDGANVSDIVGFSSADATNRANAAKTRWALVNEAGQIEAQSGGFRAVNCYQANDNCYIDAGEDVTNNGLGATISAANTDGSPVLSGEIGVAACFNTTVNCAPAGTDTNNGGNAGVILVAPRDSDGSDFEAGAPDPGPPAADEAARFYVTVTG
ncbi:MAG: hypothetical protein H0T43_01460 [Solirubrobacterales bacterium]|nr:hypothetical protein [Solirubrobacterales bacterium]